MDLFGTKGQIGPFWAVLLSHSFETCVNPTPVSCHKTFSNGEQGFGVIQYTSRPLATSVLAGPFLLCTPTREGKIQGWGWGWYRTSPPKTPSATSRGRASHNKSAYNVKCACRGDPNWLACYTSARQADASTRRQCS